jgi:hypothetical protein
VRSPNGKVLPLGGLFLPLKFQRAFFNGNRKVEKLLNGKDRLKIPTVSNIKFGSRNRTATSFPI